MPYTKEEARLKIQKLVDDFRAHEATLENAPEAQIENNFIRPLFRYLNWNMENEGLSHAHYEFKVQATNKKGLRPDYILNLDGRDVLVMDAKQVKYSMRDSRWLYQVYSYAYSTQNSKPSEKIDFAILTDFQEFIVLDCTLFAAKPEAVNNFRVLDWTYDDYVEKFDELWELLERNNVLKDSRPPVIASRSLAKQSPTDGEGIASGQSTPLAMTRRGLWSRYLSPQKVKANRISPDKAFLAEMDDEKSGWRVLLAKDMKKRNASADGELITAAVQLLIDRLIFIKALSDREVDRDYLSEMKERVTEAGLGEEDASWFKSCKVIFDELNNFYNGSIFAPRPELENVSVSNKVVRSVITDLQPENSPYNFAVLPVEILGTIYERFLGRVVRTTEKRVTIEEKPEVRKAGGVYYTPQYIVEYIVQNTLGKLLEDCKTPADAAKLKVLDPACGSGSFLLGAYSKLIEWHKDYFARTGKEKRDRESFYKDESGGIRLTAKLKRDILKNNLFGVDIDPQAVEVTRFSLSLKALEDLREGELTEERTLFHQTVLPELSENIKNGNSLIGTDYFGLFAPTAEELKEVKPFNWKAEFKEIMENGGFDCVIGNPPYIDSEWLTKTNPKLRDYCVTHYQSAKGNWDIFCIFVEKNLELTKHYSSMIVPNKLLSADYARATRNYITSKHSIVTIRDFSSVPVFPVAVYPIVYVVRANDSNFGKAVSYDVMKQIDNGEVFVEKEFSVSREKLKQLEGKNWSVLLGGEKGNLVQKIQENSMRLDEVATVNGAATVSEAYEYKDYLINEPTKEDYFVFINTGTIDRYSILWGIKPTTYIKSKYVKPVIPKRNWGKMSQNRLTQANSKKIIVGGMNKRLECVFDNGKIVAGKSTSIIYSKEVSLLYLLGILNSKLIAYYYGSVFSGLSLQGGFFRIGPPQLKELPIKILQAENPQYDKMVSLVSQMLELHKSRAGAKTQSEQDVYERQIHAVDEAIDRLVYELYGLSEEEIKIVAS
jgi:type I restriction-modification system DNA methylase subunit